jgi:hypothetical protein
MTQHFGTLATVTSKTTGETESVPVSNISLDAPSVVKLRISRSEIDSYERQGLDLVTTLKSGQSIRVENFYLKENGKISELVVVEEDGKAYVAKYGSVANLKFERSAGYRWTQLCC